MASAALVLIVFCSACGSRAPAEGRAVMATIDGEAVYEEDVLPAIDSQLQQLRTQEYTLKSRALEAVIQQRVLEGEARRRGIPVQELLRLEVDSKISEPTNAQAQAFYEERKDLLKRPLDDELRQDILQTLKQVEVREMRSAYINRLRAGSNVTLLLQPHRVQVAHDPARIKGNPDAPVTIVEFSDFECPFCREVQPTLGRLMDKYAGKIRLSYRDFPLREIHPNADAAAHAARCAGNQGKFWEFHDRLFADQSRLDLLALKEHARTLKLDEKQFDACLEDGKYRDAVQQDLETGMQSGISGTPGFFINGIPLSGAQPLSAFEQIIDLELKRKP
jgi:protein-disulfide isomerase